MAWVQDETIQLISLIILWTTILTGCGHSVYEPMEGAYYRDPKVNLNQLGTVALVELDNKTEYPAFSRDVTDAILVAIQKQQRFTIKLIRQDEQVWRSIAVRPDNIMDPQVSATIRRSLGQNGLMLGEVTEYKPFPHLRIGLRMRLFDLRSSRLVWAVDQIWDASDRSTGSRIKEFLYSQTRASRGSMAEQLTSISTISFLRFVAFEVAQTL